MVMVDVTKTNLQKLRDEGWDSHMEKVTSFMAKYDIEVPNMEGQYIVPGRRMYRGKGPHVTNIHNFRVEVFLSVIDLQLQELENRFPEVSKELLVCMSCFNPANRFHSFDKRKLVQLAKFYPDEFSSSELLFFEHSLENFIVDVRNDERFWNLKSLSELSTKLVETGMFETHDRVYLLLKLVLIIPVATASVERVFSGMTQVKDKLRNSMGDQMLNDCLITHLERDLFYNVSMDDIVHQWLANVVMVKKENVQWRMCVDFTDLNKACPKDYYPLPRIDQLVDSTSGHALLRFMDAFSGYHQISLHNPNRQKTTFITEGGVYNYIAMPFRLKNA
ncbi:uncharacterized protein LOC110713478 [Chenopodium quinoa]|uniref:uncharacterized protein LOC110713478 n=1 Tax=Chenopodium quinoa TaxID=63459 RepID=UPI000B77E505|nr:uncharacterized protein LOC110713478 [Chenopodium quinoa]